MPKVLHIRFLGGFELTYNGESLTGSIPKRLQSLLAYLVIHRNLPQPRQQVAFSLWPDSNEAQARTNLRRALHKLRQVLDDAEQFVVIKSKSLQWRTDAPCLPDIVAFEDAIAAAVTAKQQEDDKTAISALEQTTELYKGKLLPDCYDEWIEPERERLHQDCLQAHTKLMVLLQAQQQYGKVIGYAQQVIRVDPLNEPAYTHLIECYLVMGDRTHALQTYHRCMTLLREELGLDPSRALQDLYSQLLDESEPAQRAVELGLSPETIPPGLVAESDHISHLATVHSSWGNAPDVSLFYGRTDELATLKQWIQEDHCRIIALLGMGGVGKTSLSVKMARDFAQQTQSPFDYIIWRSLRNAPSLEDLLGDIIPILSDQQETELTLARLTNWLRQSRCLLILDNMETLLQGEQRPGQFYPGYEVYGELLRLVGETNHQSCLMLTSREKPREFSALEGMDLSVRSQLLSGSPEAAIALVQAKGLLGSEQQQRALCQFYGHNPLALKIVATSIQDLFDGDIAEFHTPDSAIFSGIHQLLEQQFQRCTSLEKTVMFWLAINREWTSITELAQDIVPKISRSALLEALESLMWRSLIEKQAGRYAQQPVVMEYVTAQLVQEICRHILSMGQTQEKQEAPSALSTSLFCTHALLKAQGSDYIRQIQIREILQPVLEGLVGQCGSQTNSEPCLRQALAGVQANPALQSSYAAGNILNLLSQTSLTLEDYDFSGLALRQADLQRVNLYGCNLQRADLSQTVFLVTLSLPLALAFSPDGSRLATGDAKGDIQIWNVEDGKHLMACSGHDDWIWSIAFSPDGQILASGSSDHTIKLWDTTTCQCRQTLQGHTAQVWSVAFDPHKQILASASEDQTVKLWDIETGNCDQTLRGHTDWVRSVAFNPDGTQIASGSDDQTIKLWDTQTGTCCQTLQGHAKRIWTVAYAHQSKAVILASSSSDHTIKLWDINTGGCLRTLEGHSNWVRSIAISPNGEILASGSEDKTLKLWEIATGNCLQTLREHRNWVRSVAFSPNGETLASGSGDNTIKLWQVSDGQCRRTLRGYIDRIWSVAFSPVTIQEQYGSLLASANDDHCIKLWNLNDSSYRQTLSGHTNSVCAVEFSPRAPLLASGSEDHTVKLWDIETSQCLRTFKGHSSRVWTVAFSAKGGLLASGSEDQTIRLWDIDTGQSLRVFHGHTNWVCSVAFSPADPLWLASGSYDQTIKLWDPFTGDCLQTLAGHSNWVWSIAFSPNGHTLASGSGDHTIKLWNLQAGKCETTLEGHSSRVWSVAFSPDGQLLASASSDKTVKIWEVCTGVCLKTLEGHTNLAWSVAFSPDGQLLASGSQDETIHLWDCPSGAQRAVLRGICPYDRTNILEATGLTEAQRMSLKQLGAVEKTVTEPSIVHLNQPQPIRLLSGTSLVGRQQEWDQLQTWISAANRTTSPDLLLLVGESGIGKTRLLEALSQSVQEGGGPVLWGSGFEAQMVRPFGIWLDALRAPLTSPSQPLLADLGALFPQLKGDQDQPIVRNRLFDEVAAYLTTLATTTAPVLILFDDIQWLDEVSTALLHYLICLLGPSSIQFACTARHQELEANIAACQLVKTLRRDRRLQLISLEPLDRQATAELVHTIDANLESDRIYTDSGGNPLFALEIARAMANGNRTHSDSLEALVQDRLQHLNPVTLDLLTWAAAMGRSFNPMQVASIADCPLTTFLAAMEELEQQGILSPEAIVNAEGGYLFAHDVVRQVAYRQLSEPRRRLMHRHIAQQLQTMAGSDDVLANDIAYHATLGQDTELATTALLAAAERGLRLSAYADAAELAQRGIEQCQSLAAPLRISLHLRLLKVSVLSGVTSEQAKGIDASLSHLVLEARRLGMQDEEVVGMEVLIALNYEQDNLTRVHEHCLQVAEQGRSASPVVTAQMLAYTGWCLADIGREMPRAEALLLEAQSLAHRVGLEPFDIPCGLGCVHRYRGDYDEAHPLLEKARRMAGEIQDHWREFTCVSYLVMLELEEGNASAALRYCQELIAGSAQLEGGNEASVAAAFETLVNYWLEQPNAETALAERLKILKHIDAQRILAYTLTSAAEKDLEQDQPKQAISRCQAALVAARVVDQPSDVALAWAFLIRGYLAIGEMGLAVEQFKELQQFDLLHLSARTRREIATISTQLGQPTCSVKANAEV